MSIIPQKTCPNCGAKYPAYKAQCPECGAAAEAGSSRAAATTDSVRPGTRAHKEAVVNTKAQFIFGCVLSVIVIIAVIVLISVSTKGTAKTEVVEETEVIETTPVPTRTPIPTPTPTPTPAVTSISITFLGNPLTDDEFSMNVSDNPIQLEAQAYPLDVEATIDWTSDNPEVATVDETGLVTAVGSGWATITASCGAVSYSVKCLVW